MHCFSVVWCAPTKSEPFLDFSSLFPSSPCHPLSFISLPYLSDSAFLPSFFLISFPSISTFSDMILQSSSYIYETQKCMDQKSWGRKKSRKAKVIISLLSLFKKNLSIWFSIWFFLPWLLLYERPRQITKPGIIKEPSEWNGCSKRWMNCDLWQDKDQHHKLSAVAISRYFPDHPHGDKDRGIFKL